MRKRLSRPLRRRQPAAEAAKAAAEDSKGEADDGRGEALGIAPGSRSYDHTWNYQRLGKRR